MQIKNRIQMLEQVIINARAAGLDTAAQPPEAENVDLSHRRVIEPQDTSSTAALELEVEVLRNSNSTPHASSNFMLESDAEPWLEESMIFPITQSGLESLMSPDVLNDLNSWGESSPGGEMRHQLRKAFEMSTYSAPSCLSSQLKTTKATKSAANYDNPMVNHPSFLSEILLLTICNRFLDHHKCDLKRNPRKGKSLLL